MRCEGMMTIRSTAARVGLGKSSVSGEFLQKNSGSTAARAVRLRDPGTSGKLKSIQGFEGWNVG